MYFSSSQNDGQDMRLANCPGHAQRELMSSTSATSNAMSRFAKISENGSTRCHRLDLKMLLHTHDCVFIPAGSHADFLILTVIRASIEEYRAPPATP